MWNYVIGGVEVEVLGFKMDVAERQKGGWFHFFWWGGAFSLPFEVRKLYNARRFLPRLLLY